MEERPDYAAHRVPPVARVADLDEYERRVARACGGFEKTLYQNLMGYYLSRRSPHRGLLMYHQLGSGKTCSSITIAEAMLADHTGRDPPRVWVISSASLRRSYEEQLFTLGRGEDQCLGDFYERVVSAMMPAAAGPTPAEAKERAALLQRRVQGWIRKRYEFLTYDGLASRVEQMEQEGKLDDFRDSVVIVDEAHNLRENEPGKGGGGKAATEALAKLLRWPEGTQTPKGNRLVLLTATPMYNEPEDLFHLLRLLLVNDGREEELPGPAMPALFTKKEGKPSRSAFEKLGRWAAEYISYIRSGNPFSFAPRVRPSQLGIPVMQEPWAASIPDELVPTPLGTGQSAAGAAAAAGTEAAALSAAARRNDTRRLQGEVVTYPFALRPEVGVGESGFFGVFQRVGTEDPLRVRYIASTAKGVPEDRKEVLAPGLEGRGLSVWGAKLDRLCQMLRGSEGIVVVYSQFIWGGIVPLAIALEHMGFSRYGTRGFLSERDVRVEGVPRATYPGVPFPSYCILSGTDTRVMGPTRISSLVRAIGAPDNLHGERVKVVLMTPVAGEGLSLRNVREVHILDPWYHLNRLNQVVGRAIRTCSHTSLPVPERNVSVFLHCATAPATSAEGAEETADIHSYRIAARKSGEIAQLDRFIRDHAFDCSLQKNVNYFPQEDLFDFTVPMRTSRGTTLAFRFGDGPELEPQCVAPAAPAAPNAAPAAPPMRPEQYQHLVPSALRRLSAYLREHPDAAYFEETDLLAAIGSTAEAVGRAALAQAVSEEGWLVPQRDGVYARPPAIPEVRSVWVSGVVPAPRATVAAAPSAAPEATAGPSVAVPSVREPAPRPELLKKLAVGRDLSSATVALYLDVLRKKTWDALARAIVVHDFTEEEREAYRHALAALEASGALIRTEELPPKDRAGFGGPSGYAGYADVFATGEGATLTAILYEKGTDGAQGTFRAATEREEAALRKARRVPERPRLEARVLYGLIEPGRRTAKRDTSRATASEGRNQFRLMQPLTEGAVTRTGVVCNAGPKKPDLLAYYRELAGAEAAEAATAKNKDNLCYLLAEELHRKGLLFTARAARPTTTR